MKTIPTLSAADKQRFWRKVQQSDKESCWIWTAFLDDCGYGIFGVRRRIFRAHRVVLFLALGGEFDHSLCVCHSCDNPACCNPHHLFQATHDGNMKDMVRKGRGKGFRGPRDGWQYHRGDAHWSHRQPEKVVRGERQGRSKLTETSVRDIRQRFRDGETKTALARAFKVSFTLISYVVSGKIWRHVV